MFLWTKIKILSFFAKKSLPILTFYIFVNILIFHIARQNGALESINVNKLNNVDSVSQSTPGKKILSYWFKRYDFPYVFV